MCFGDSIHARPSASRSSALFPAVVGSAEDTSIAAGEYVISRAARGSRGRECADPIGRNISADFAITSIEIIPARTAAIGPGHAGCKGLATGAVTECAITRIDQVISHFMRMDKTARPPPAVPTPMLARMIAPPALVERPAEPADTAPVQAHVKTPCACERIERSSKAPGAGRREIGRAIPAGIGNSIRHFRAARLQAN